MHEQRPSYRCLCSSQAQLPPPLPLRPLLPTPPSTFTAAAAAFQTPHLRRTCIGIFRSYA